MNENNELLMHIYQTADMGEKSTTKLINLLKNKDNKIKKVLEFKAKSEKYLKKQKIDPKSLGIMAEMMADMEMKMQVMKDNSDSKMASMLIEGFTMGTIEMNKKIDAYKEESQKEIIKIAEELLKFQEEEIEKLKKYL